MKGKDSKLWAAFSIYIRNRDADENGICTCITCGLRRHWKQMDCGHGIPRQHWGTRYDERNNSAQCKKCNGFEGGSQEVYSKAVDKKFGPGTWDLLLVKKQTGKRLSDFEIKHLTEYYKQKTILK
jgi:hypothetical protein